MHVTGLNSQLTGPAATVANAIVASGSDPAAHFAAELFATMDGPGTRDRRLVRLVLSRSEEDMGAIKEAFAAKYGKSLATCIKGDTSGAYELMLLKLVGE